MKKIPAMVSIVAKQISKIGTNMDDLMTLDEAAQSLGVTKTTIRRRIKRGEVHAIKKQGPYGEQYFVPRNEISTVQEVTDVIPVIQQINLLTLGNIIEQAVSLANEPLKKEFMERINKISIEIASIKQHEGETLKNIAELQKEVRSIKLVELDYEAQLKKLNAYLKGNLQALSKKTLCERIFGKKK